MICCNVDWFFFKVYKIKNYMNYEYLMIFVFLTLPSSVV
jgi:hypothetical protein